MQTVGVALLGVGTVGSAVAKTLQDKGDELARRTGLRIDVRWGMARHPERVVAAGLPEHAATTSIDPILEDPDVVVVVEALGGEEPAATYLKRALLAGKHVVTANKEALSKHFAELVAVARERQRALLFEASVGAGIPLMASLRQLLSVNRVERIRGIVNGTTNFILTMMAEEGVAYHDALREAQRRGYAEPDPTADVEGFDAAYKLSILASLVAGRHIHPERIDRRGITSVTPDQILDARTRGGAVKLIAEAVYKNGDWELRVHPVFVSGNDLLAHVRLNLNAIELTCDRVGTVVLYGPGAGPAPTAAALIADVIDAVRFGPALLPRIDPAG
ncbi:homoserine dehydrogenase [Thermomicrobium sp. 4228-Ro]|uniref:homoserine dehydrogenase n=1 Tax=Thermomicrobium sp. 4228-Ro TaxID=2993937 RepID=UPI0022492EB8|nr:homoserine dehydrogenase [Thermomicrobium sp. 4228-Ro]MCX2726493.1 homoserine dehydrogenase [Thermomicrobium sp. 4228-Ro]